MHGITWTATVDAALDEISRRDKDRQTALDALTALIRNRPELEHDNDLVTARMCLLR